MWHCVDMRTTIIELTSLDRTDRRRDGPSALRIAAFHWEGGMDDKA